LAGIVDKKTEPQQLRFFMSELISYQTEQLFLSIPWIAFQSCPVNFRHKKRTELKA
jgi:hypothetical protein